MAENDNEVIDLDAVLPLPTTIKFEGVEIKIAPPDTANVVKLEYLVNELDKAGERSDEQIQGIVDEIRERVTKCIPELNGKTLAGPQLLKLVGIISDMAVPPDVKELEKRGITVGDPKKKAP